MKLNIKITNCSYYIGNSNKYRKGMNIRMYLPIYFDKYSDEAILEWLKKQNLDFFICKASKITKRTTDDYSNVYDIYYYTNHRNIFKLRKK